MTKILLPLLFYVSGVLNPLDVNSSDTYYISNPTIETILYTKVYGPEMLIDEHMCKPTGVETIIYTDAKVETTPAKKETVRVKSNKAKNQPAVKVSKKKPAKKIQKKKA